MVTTTTTNGDTTITLSPNRSADWQDIRLWLFILSIPALIVGVGWFALGVWIILPFVGLELGLLSYFMYKVCYQNYRKQQIVINEDTVTIESGIHQPDQKQIFLRPECYLLATKPNHPIERLALTLTNQSTSLPIGEFLNPKDLELTRRSLVNAGLIECSNRWWDRS